MADFQLFSIDDLGHLPPPKWLIKDMFEANSLVMVAGPPGSFKSFLVLDWILSMAVGRQWNMRETAEVKSLYILGEGKSSLFKRSMAWTHHAQLSAVERMKLNQNFRVMFDVPQLVQKASVDNMLASLAKENFRPEIIVIDTFARSFVGMDENSQQDVGLWVDAADRLRSLGITVLFLHHTAKNTEFGVRYRGSTAIQGALDTAIVLVRDPEAKDEVKLTITKQKDHDEGDPMNFKRVLVTPPGEREGSIVLVPTIRTDDRFSERGNEDKRQRNLMIQILTENPGISEWSAGKMLSEKIGVGEDGKPIVDENAARSRIVRYRKSMLSTPVS